MAKKIVRIIQTYYVDAIMDIADNEPNESIEKRINAHLSNNGTETVISQGGKVAHVILEDVPDKYDEDTYECID